MIIRWGAGDGTTRRTDRIDAGGALATLTVGDFDGDCVGDLALILKSGAARVLLNRGGGKLDPAPVDQPVQLGPYSTAVGDFNHDHKLDLLVGDNQFPHRASIELLLGNGDGTFQPARVFDSGFQTTSVATADLDGDGHLDAVVGTAPANGTGPDYPLWVHLGDGKGAFTGPRYYGLYPAISQVALADFDGNGRPDIAFTGYVFLAGDR